MYLICGDRETGEAYLVAPVRGGHGAENPIVRVLLILRYPRQHAIWKPEVATEIAPLPAGCVCRLPVLRAADEREAARYGSYAESLAAAQRRALTAARTEGEREIVLRHMAGKYRPRRSVMIYRPHDIEVWERNHDDQFSAGNPDDPGLCREAGAEQQRAGAAAGAAARV